VTDSVLFKVPAAEGFSVVGFMKADGSADVIATYDKSASDTAAKRYVYIVDGKPVTIGTYHGSRFGSGQAAKAILTAIGKAPASTVKASATAPASTDAVVAEVMKALKSAGIIPAPAPVTRVRGARK